MVPHNGLNQLDQTSDKGDGRKLSRNCSQLIDSRLARKASFRPIGARSRRGPALMADRLRRSRAVPPSCAHGAEVVRAQNGRIPDAADSRMSPKRLKIVAWFMKKGR